MLLYWILQTILILRDHCLICGLLLTETSLCGAWVYSHRQCATEYAGVGQLSDTELSLIISNWVTRHPNYLNDICARRCSPFQKFLLRLRNKFLRVLHEVKKKALCGHYTWTSGTYCPVMMVWNLCDEEVGTGKVKREDITFITAQDVGRKYKPQIHRPLEHLQLA